MSGCSQSDSTLEAQYLQQCVSSSALPAIPDAQLPCDRVELPDSSGVIYSEFEGSNKGSLLLRDNSVTPSKIVYNALSSNDMTTNNAIWGEPNCEEPDHFEATSIDLWRRYSGRWQLAVINNMTPQTVELFELSQSLSSAENNIDPPQWSVNWRGCIFVDARFPLKKISVNGNDIKAIQVNTPVRESRWKKWFMLADKKRGNPVCWQWRLDQGWKITRNNNCKKIQDISFISNE
jgi:hypothetical protein